MRITKLRNERYLVVTLRYERVRNKSCGARPWSPIWIASVIRFVNPASKAKAHNYYNGETARGCIRWSCDLSTGYGSSLRSRIVTSPAIPSSMITVRVSKKGPPGPPAAFTCAKSAVTHEIACRSRPKEPPTIITCDCKVMRRGSKFLSPTHHFGNLIGCN